MSLHFVIFVQESQGSQKRGRKRRDPADDGEEGGTQSSPAKNALSKSEMDRKVFKIVL